MLTRFLFRFAALGAFVLIAAAANAQTTKTNRFGFSGPEIFPIDNQIGQLRSADINGDGKLDLVIANNTRAKINILINQTGNTNQADTAGSNRKPEFNELPPDSRFRIDSIASEKRISGLVVADLNNDNRADLAYYGEPKELVVQYNQGTNWAFPKRWQIGDETSLTGNALTSGDLNGDKLTDLLLLAENYVFVLLQNTNGVFDEPQKLPFTGTVKSIQVLDIDGNGRDDLLCVNWDDPNPFRFRLQDMQGQLGPEFYFSLPAIRSYWADDLDRDKKTEVITIAQNSGRAQVSNFKLKDAEVLNGAFKQGQFQILPLNKTSRTRRGVAWTDVNADKLPDLLVAEPDSGQLSLYLQSADGMLVLTNTFPALSGVSDISVVDWEGDGKQEIFMLSRDERQVGVARFDDKGKISFPNLVPLEGKPLAMTVGTIDPKKKPMLATILTSADETNRVLVTRTADGQSRTQKLSEKFKSNPGSMAIHDADQDGLPDIVVLIPYEKIKVFRQVSGKDFEELDVLSPGGTSEQPWMSSADVDGDGKSELLLAQSNFLRAVVLKPDGDPKGTNKLTWSFEVKEQINGASSNSRIVAAAPLRNGTNSVASLFLLDAERKTLTLSERDQSGVWQVVRNLPLPLTDFNMLQPVSVGGANANAIGFIGVNAVAWMNLQGKVWEFTELDHYESPIKDSRLHDVISGDLNNDRRKDLVFLETSKNYVDLVMFEPPHTLVPANRWPVFEERTFRSRRGDMAEPREALIGDVTGDGRNDLIVLVHDRLLLYPQE